MRLLLRILLLFTLAASSYAQVISTGPEASNWYFGENSFIKFDLTSGQIKSGFSPLSTEEGSACISDKLGNILFYCSGQTIWNRNNQVMMGGADIYGGRSSTQAALIIQQPGVNDMFYVFNTGDHGTNLYYSIIDMKGDGGFGEVISANNLLYPDVGEKLTASYAQNGYDIWIIVKDKLTHSFLTFLIDSKGINPLPKVSYNELGFDLNDKTCTMGYLKFSPDGKHLASASFCVGQFELYDFDNFTGLITNPRIIKIDSGLSAYGLCFSPDSRLLYVTGYNYECFLYQYNLNIADENAIRSSKQIISYFNDGFSMGAIQQGPDNKLYLSRYKNKYLSVIENPNAIGPSCGFKEDGIYLNGNRTRLGLPNFAFVNYYTDFFPNPAKHDIFIYSEGFRASPSDEKTIRIYLKSLKDSLKNIEVNLNFDVVFEAQAFSPFDNGIYQMNLIEGRNRRLRISKDKLSIDTNNTLIFEIPGIVLFGDKSKYEIRIENIVWSDTTIRTFTKFGIITLEEICKTDLRRIAAIKNFMNIAPNPVYDDISVSFITEIAGDYFIKISDVNGRLLLMDKMNGLKQNEKIVRIIDTDEWPSGIYNVQLYCNGRIENSKLFSICK